MPNEWANSLISRRHKLRVMVNVEFQKGLSSTDELQITVIGRWTGKKFSTPVWFVSERDKLYLLPVKGSASNWYKNILKEPTMELKASGKKATARAKPITDKKDVIEIVEKFRLKHGPGQVKKYYSKFDTAVELSI